MAETNQQGLIKWQPKDASLAEVMELGKVMAMSAMFPDIKDQAQAVVKIIAGRELGFNPVYALTKIYIVKGKVAVSAEAMGAMIKRSGRYDYRVSKYTDDEVELIFTDNGKDVFTSHFSMKDAKNADLVQPNSGWAKWPRAMLMSKALSQGARIVCPHIISGAYTPEDFGMEVDDEGEIVNQTPDKPAVNVEAVKPTEAEIKQSVDDLWGKEDAKPPADEPALQESYVNLDWLRESLKTLQDRKILAYQNKSVLLHLKNRYGVEGKSISEAVSKLDKEQAKEFAEGINKSLETVKAG